MRYSILTLLIAATLMAAAIVGGRWLWEYAPQATQSIGWGILTMWGTLILNRLRRTWELPGVLPVILIVVLAVIAASIVLYSVHNPLGVALGWGLGVGGYHYGYPILEWGLLKSGVESDVSR